ncbi:MAG: 4Fe-4S binding protein [Chloroflexi bacterium]|nr:4Fe-4S binding protein [Chloroflexota bacterium]
MALKGTVVIDQERCKGCQLCTTVCPQNVLLLSPELLNAKGYHPALLDETFNACTGCGVCAVICPDACIVVYRTPSPRRAELQEVAHA